MFAAGSLAIAALGQYAAMAFTVRRRVREYGIRVALGASSGQIVSEAVGEGLLLTAAGLAVGLAFGYAASRGAGSLLFGITPADPVTYLGVLLVLGPPSLVACALPAHRYARVDPMTALRQE